MKQRIQSIQALRGIAALLVVICHAGTMFEAYSKRFGLSFPPFYSLLWIDLGACGVDIFFVISGFIMAYVAWEHFGEKGYPKTFFIHRLIRIVPIYWVCTTVMAICFLWIPSLIQSGRSTSLVHILCSYFFIPHSDHGDRHPILGVGWSLNYEMFFYLIFTIFLPLRRMWALTAIATTLVAVVLLGIFTYQWFLSSTVILEFGYGILLGIVFRKNASGLSFRFAPIFNRSLFLGGFALLGLLLTHFGFPSDLIRGFLVGIPSLLIVLGTLGWEDHRIPNGLIRLGNASYSLYLTHFFIGVAIARVWVRLLPHAPSWALTLLMIFIPCGIALLCYDRFELPLTRALSKWSKSSHISRARNS